MADLIDSFESLEDSEELEEEERELLERLSSNSEELTENIEDVETINELTDSLREMLEDPQDPEDFNSVEDILLIQKILYELDGSTADLSDEIHDRIEELLGGFDHARLSGFFSGEYEGGENSEELEGRLENIKNISYSSTLKTFYINLQDVGNEINVEIDFDELQRVYNQLGSFEHALYYVIKGSDIDTGFLSDDEVLQDISNDYHEELAEYRAQQTEEERQGEEEELEEDPELERLENEMNCVYNISYNEGEQEYVVNYKNQEDGLIRIDGENISEPQDLRGEILNKVAEEVNGEFDGEVIYENGEFKVNGDEITIDADEINGPSDLQEFIEQELNGGESDRGEDDREESDRGEDDREESDRGEDDREESERIDLSEMDSELASMLSNALGEVVEQNDFINSVSYNSNEEIIIDIEGVDEEVRIPLNELIEDYSEFDGDFSDLEEDDIKVEEVFKYRVFAALSDSFDEEELGELGLEGLEGITYEDGKFVLNMDEDEEKYIDPYGINTRNDLKNFILLEGVSPSDIDEDNVTLIRYENGQFTIHLDTEDDTVLEVNAEGIENVDELKEELQNEFEARAEEDPDGFFDQMQEIWSEGSFFGNLMQTFAAVFDSDAISLRTSSSGLSDEERRERANSDGEVWLGIVNDFTSEDIGFDYLKTQLEEWVDENDLGDDYDLQGADSYEDLMDVVAAYQEQNGIEGEEYGILGPATLSSLFDDYLNDSDKDTMQEMEDYVNLVDNSQIGELNNFLSELDSSYELDIGFSSGDTFGEDTYEGLKALLTNENGILSDLVEDEKQRLVGFFDQDVLDNLQDKIPDEVELPERFHDLVEDELEHRVDEEVEEDGVVDEDRVEDEDRADRERGIDRRDTNPEQDIQLLESGGEIAQFIQNNFETIHVQTGEDNFVRYYIPNDRVNDDTLQRLNALEENQDWDAIETLVQGLKESSDVQNGGPYTIGEGENSIEIDKLALTGNEIVQAYSVQNLDGSPNIGTWNTVRGERTLWRDEEAEHEKLRDSLSESDAEHAAENIEYMLRDNEIDFDEFVRLMSPDIESRLGDIVDAQPNLSLDDNILTFTPENGEERRVDINDYIGLKNLFENYGFRNPLDDLYDLYNNPDEDNIEDKLQQMGSDYFVINEDGYAFDIDGIQDGSITRGSLNGEDIFLRTDKIASIDELDLEQEEIDILSQMPEGTQKVGDQGFLTIKDGELYFTGKVDDKPFELQDLIPDWYQEHGDYVRDPIILALALKVFGTPNLPSLSMPNISLSTPPLPSLSAISSNVWAALGGLGVGIAGTRMYYSDEIQAARHYEEQDTVSQIYADIVDTEGYTSGFDSYTGDTFDAMRAGEERDHSFMSAPFNERVDEDGNTIQVFTAPEGVDTTSGRWIFSSGVELDFRGNIPGIDHEFGTDPENESVELEEIKEVALYQTDDGEYEINREHTKVKLSVNPPGWTGSDEVEINGVYLPSQARDIIRNRLKGEE